MSFDGALPRPDGSDPEPEILRLADTRPLPRSKDLSPAMTLSAFYLAFYLPKLIARQASSETIELYDKLIDHWVRITGDPPVNQIDDMLITRFQAGLARLPGKKPGSLMLMTTINKHCRHLRAILNCVGPRTDQRRGGQSLVNETPYVEIRRVAPKDVEEVWTIDEFARILSAAIYFMSRKIVGIHGGVWMRSLLVLLYNGGCRIGCALELRWEWLQKDEDGNLWLHVPAWASHAKGGAHAIRVAVNQWAEAAIEAMRPVQAAGPDARIFPATAKNLDSRVQKWLKRVLGSTGIPRQRRFSFQAIRRLANMEMHKIDPLMCEPFLGHVSHSINSVHYTQVRTTLAAAVARLRQPQSIIAEQRLFPFLANKPTD